MTSVIDIHAHLNVPAAQRMMKAAAERGDVSAAARNQGGIGITGERSANEMVLSDPEWRIKDMDKMGVDFAALSSGAPKGFYEADTNLAMTVAQHVNDHTASVVKAFPDRFAAMAIAPLQHVDLAIKETERAVRTLGLKAIRFPCDIAGMELSDSKLEPYWDAVEKLGIPVYVHPQGFSHPQRFKAFYMSNVVSNPLETTLATSHLIHAGVPKRHPRIKFYTAHGGGFFPFYLGRFDHAWETREECRVHIDQPPSAYIDSFYFDTVVFRPQQIRHLVDLVGAEHVMLGTDSPYDMGETDPVGLVNQVERLSAAERDLILGNGARKLLRLN
jgi:aminocarboxymuconate-semialdehyde decarboxylase